MDYYESVRYVAIFLLEEKALKGQYYSSKTFIFHYPIVALNLTFLILKSIPFS